MKIDLFLDRGFVYIFSLFDTPMHINQQFATPSIVEKSRDSKKIMSEAQHIMSERFGVYECTIQVEEFTDDMQDCSRCMDPAD